MNQEVPCLPANQITTVEIPGWLLWDTTGIGSVVEKARRVGRGTGGQRSMKYSSFHKMESLGVFLVFFNYFIVLNVYKNTFFQAFIMINSDWSLWLQSPQILKVRISSVFAVQDPGGFWGTLTHVAFKVYPFGFWRHYRMRSIGFKSNASSHALHVAHGHLSVGPGFYLILFFLAVPNLPPRHISSFHVFFVIFFAPNSWKSWTQG